MVAYKFTPPDPIQLSDFVALIAMMMANDIRIVCDEATAVALDANPDCKRLLTKVEKRKRVGPDALAIATHGEPDDDPECKRLLTKVEDDPRCPYCMGDGTRYTDYAEPYTCARCEGTGLVDQNPDLP